MASLFRDVEVRAGACSAKEYEHSGRAGDWQTFNVAFVPPFPDIAAGKIRVFASPNDLNVQVRTSIAPASPVVGEISSRGFTAWARNSDIARGQSGLSWVAIAECSERENGQQSAVFGVMGPQYFTSAATRGDWRVANVEVPKSRGDQPPVSVVATPGNANVRVHASASIPIICAAKDAMFALAARNSDCGPGLASFNYLAFGSFTALKPNTLVDTGRVSPKYFRVGSQRGDWQAWAVSFSTHFLVPPVVIVTADNFDGKINSYAVAAVPLANDITPYGFTLASRNSDVVAGWVAFSWLAIGYEP